VLECAGTGRAYLQPRPVYVPWFDEAMGAFEYTGTPLRPLLDEAGLLGDAVEVVFTGHDEGFYEGVRHAFERSMPVDEARADGVILAWAANGQPLTPAHGFPLRLVVPSWYGMASVKWLSGITVVDHPFEGVEQVDAYRMRSSASEQGRPVQRKSVRAAMKPPGVPDVLSRARFVAAGAVPLAGMAATPSRSSPSGTTRATPRTPSSAYRSASPDAALREATWASTAPPGRVPPGHGGPSRHSSCSAPSRWSSAWSRSGRPPAPPRRCRLPRQQRRLW
jgi:DMSO/TMAO reductase YedYZ molybdopterin-dependent catalytic subunit